MSSGVYIINTIRIFSEGNSYITKKPVHTIVCTGFLVINCKYY